jgi:hypothetical protein
MGRWRGRERVSRALKIAFANLIVLCAWLALVPTAYAISAPIHIRGTGTDGVYIRPTPDTSRPALGWMAEGTSPDYHCFTYGQMIGNVNVWFNVTHNGITGYYASYYDDSSYRSEAELTSKYGIPKCGASAPAPAPTPAPAPAPGPTPAPAPAPGPTPAPPILRPIGVYYSPYGRGDYELHDQTADTVYAGQYGCKDPSRGYKAAKDGAAGHPIETLAGWSSGRQGVVSFLGAATEPELHQLTYILLIDPGNYDDLKCERDIGAGRRFARWLVANPWARLVVISTERHTQQDNSKGIKETYFASIRKRSTAQMNLRARVLTCDYPMRDRGAHVRALQTAQFWILHRIGGSKGSCPPLREGNGKTWRPSRGWHP